MVLQFLKFLILTVWYGKNRCEMENQDSSKTNFSSEPDDHSQISLQLIVIFFLSATLIGCLVNDAHSRDKRASVNGESQKGNQLNSLEELSNDFGRLLDAKGPWIADVTLKCDSGSIPAHKNILSARSPVFAAMFADSMEENGRNELYVTDIGLSTLRALLAYIYTGKTHGLTASSATNLLFAADKYQLQDLKRVCSDVLKDTVSLQNVLWILSLGDMYAEDLKSFAVDFISDNRAEFPVIEKTEEWKFLQKERHDLVMYVLTSLVNDR